MNKSLSVFLSVLLCVVLYVGVLLLRYTTDESDYWQSSQVYTSSAPAGAPAVSFGVGANGDVLAVPMSSRRSSRERYLQPSRRTTGVANLQGFSRSANSTGMLSHPSLQGGDGGRLFTHMSSSQTMKSFGGGNSSAGVSVSGGVVSTNNLTTSSPNSLLALSPNTPLTSSPNSLITSSPTSLLALSPNSLITSSPLAANYQGIGYTTGSRGISGRRNANGAIFNSWWFWLSGHNYDKNGVQDENGNWTYTYDKYDLQRLYDDFVAYWSKNFGSDDIPSYDEWLWWYMSTTGPDGYSYKNNTYLFQPIGSILPLVVMVLIYLCYTIVRRKIKVQI